MQYTVLQKMAVGINRLVHESMIDAERERERERESQKHNHIPCPHTQTRQTGNEKKKAPTAKAKCATPSIGSSRAGWRRQRGGDGSSGGGQRGARIADCIWDIKIGMLNY